MSECPCTSEPLFDLFLLAENNLGSQNTGGYGNSEGYWWSTGAAVSYTGMDVDDIGLNSVLILDTNAKIVKDGTHFPSLYFICEIGELYKYV